MFIIGIGCSLLCCKFLKTFAITFNPIPGTKNDDIFKIEAFRSRAANMAPNKHSDKNIFHDLYHGFKRAQQMFQQTIDLNE